MQNNKNDNINSHSIDSSPLSAREIAFNGLCSVNLKGGFSNLTLDSILKNGDHNNIDKRDKAFASVLFYGVIERKLTLDFFIKKLSNIPFSKINPKCIILIEMGLYQIIFMNSVPDRAAVNETVSLCYKLKLYSFKGFINGILRSFLREFPEFNINNFKKDSFKDEFDYLSIKYSINYDLAKLICNQYSFNQTESFLEKSLNNKENFLKINTLKTTVEDFCKNLEKCGYEFKKSQLINNCISIKNQSSIIEIPGFSEGEFYVQDLASQICINAINPQKGDLIIDCCSAPGSKSFSLAIEMNNIGEIRAFDLHKKRVDLIRRSAKKLGISIIETGEKNAYEYDENLDSIADIVLCDVPCSGLGTIGRRPEIKYKNLNDIENLYLIQEKILSNCAKYVKIMGKLVYSTCSINKNENENIIETFLNNNSNFELIKINDNLSFLSEKLGMITLFDDKVNADGFFICILQRKN